MTRCRSRSSLRRSATSVSRRLVRSRVIFKYPESLPLGFLQGVITTLAQKRDPSFRTRHPSSSKPAFFSRSAQLGIGPAFLESVGRIKHRKMFSNDFIGSVAFDELCTDIPTANDSIGIQQQNSVVSHPRDHC